MTTAETGIIETTAKAVDGEDGAIVLRLPDDLEPATFSSLKESFEDFYARADEWRRKASAIVVSDVSQTREMELARKTRLELREIRVEADKTRKRLKEDVLVRGRAIDGAYNVLLGAIKPLEDHLMDQEKFAERVEAERKEKLKRDREEELSKLGVNVSLYQLGEIADDAYAQLVADSKLAYEAKQEAARKAEEQRLAGEKADREEREREREENERLRKEKEDAETRERDEREAREKVEAELAARKKAEDDRIAAEAAAAEKAAQAPDKEKAIAFAGTLREMPSIAAKTKAGKALAAKINERVEALIDWIESEAAKL